MPKPQLLLNRLPRLLGEPDLRRMGLQVAQGLAERSVVRLLREAMAATEPPATPSPLTVAPAVTAAIRAQRVVAVPVAAVLLPAMEVLRVRPSPRVVTAAMAEQAGPVGPARAADGRARPPRRTTDGIL